MKKALILTVGTGTGEGADIVSPLTLAVRHANPQKVVLIISAQSQRYAEEMVRRLGEIEADYRLVADPDNVEAVFHSCLDALRTLRAEGFAPADVDADFTSGTKPMTSGLVLAAVAFGCQTLNFVTGQRLHGTVAAGTERFSGIRPQAVLAERQLDLARESLRELQFEAARRALPPAAPPLDVYGVRRAEVTSALVEAYEAWDRFEHREFMNHYRRAEADLDRISELNAFAVDKPVIDRVARMAVTSQDKDWRKTLTEDRIADLLNNADRRIVEGRFDDAVARLYRCAEMIAQYVLRSTHQIDTGNVPDDVLRSAQLDVPRARDGRRKLGLQDAYRLLKQRADPVGEAFQKAGGLSTALSARNASILAHGHVPIGKQHASILRAELTPLVTLVVADINQRCEELQFPWLRETAADELTSA
jgi:CRISPR-associated protein (TIGR02710 family)